VQDSQQAAPEFPATARARRHAPGSVTAGAIKVLILCGAASLIYYRPVSQHGIMTLHTISYRSDFLFAAAAVVALFAVSARLPRWGSLSVPERVVAAALALYLASALVATGLSAIRYHLGFDALGLAETLKACLGIILVPITYVLAKSDEGFRRWLNVTLWASPMIPLVLGVLLLARPDVYHAAFGSLRLMEPDGYRFQGLTSNPTQLGVSGGVAAAMIWPISLLGIFARRAGGAVAALIYLWGLVFITFWSVSRSVLIVLMLLLVGGAAVLCRKVLGGPGHYAGAALVLALIGVLIVLVPPPHAVATFGSRMQASDLRPMAQSSAGDESLGRPQIWRYFLGVALAHPFGVGFNYEQRYSFKNPFQTHVNAQNNVLAAWMYGGVLSAASLLGVLGGSLWAVPAGFRRARSLMDYVTYLGVVLAFLLVWAVSFASGTPVGDYLHSLLLVLMLVGSSTEPTAARNIPCTA